ncbi:MAG: LysR family transcriptional regulator [Clostridiales bacterium]|nr:LysR family transcriptional regulator [Clostridiales bacterium]
MRLEQLQYIVEIADTGSFTTASEHLFIAQPSISQAVSTLEKELNVTIFKRSRLGAEPTSIGSEIISHARKVLSETSEIRKLCSLDYSEIVDTITISTVPTLCSTILPKSISRYKKLFPNVTIKIHEDGSKKIRQEIRSGSADFGLVTRHSYIPYDDTETFQPLFSGKLMAYVSAKSALAQYKVVRFEDICTYQVVLFGDTFTLSDYIMRQLEKFGTPKILTSSRNPESVMAFVIDTDCVGFAPDVFLAKNIHVYNGDIVPLHIDDPEITQFGILTNPNRSISTANEMLMKEILIQAQHFERVYLNHM